MFFTYICFRIKFDFKPVKKDTLVQIVPGFVHQTVRLTHVNTRADHVLIESTEVSLNPFCILTPHSTC